MNQKQSCWPIFDFQFPFFQKALLLAGKSQVSGHYFDKLYDQRVEYRNSSFVKNIRSCQ